MALASGQQALLNYLDDLLLDIETPSAAPLPTALAEQPLVNKQQLQSLLDSAYQPVVLADAPLPEATFAPQLAPTQPPSIQTPTTQPPLAAPWKNSPFDALLLQVAGLRLAVPINALGHIYPIGLGLNRLPQQPPWLMGLLNTPRGSIRTLNTALFVMPERYNAAFEESAQYVVTLHGVPLGLAVDTIEQPITLQPQQVVWRAGGASKRPWLAGTVKSHLCALLDLHQLAECLHAY